MGVKQGKKNLHNSYLLVIFYPKTKMVSKTKI